MNKNKSFEYLFGLEIRKKRIQQSKTMEELAHEVHTSRGYMGQIERGETEIGSYMLFKLHFLLGLDLNKLFDEIRSKMTDIDGN